MAADLLGHMDGFEAVSLPELESHAGLQTRVDRKYIVSYETLERLSRELGDDYRALEIDGERLQRYDSVYFDTPELTGYKEHLQGRRKRFKCRTRLYGGTACFFDLKLKGRRGETVKSRFPLSPRSRLAVRQGARFSSGAPRGVRQCRAGGAGADDAEIFRAAHAGPLAAGGAPDVRFRHHVQQGWKRRALSHAPRPRADRDQVGVTARHGGPASASARRAAGHEVQQVLPRYRAGEPELPTNPYRPLLRRYFDSTPVPAAPALTGLAASVDSRRPSPRGRAL